MQTETKPVVVALVGNPNCGKTTVFNALTGARQRVGNWPGVTVEKKTGEYHLHEATVTVVDLPGTYSLDVLGGGVSIDERVTRDFMRSDEASLIINIVDASNLERNLYLTSQLLEMGVPLLVALNMVDVAREKNMQVDADVLARRLGCPVVPLVASSGEGVMALKEAIAAHAAHAPQAVEIVYDESIEAQVAALLPALCPVAEQAAVPARWLALRLLEGDELARAIAGKELSTQASVRARTLGEDADILFASARYDFANRVSTEAVKITGEVSRDLTERIDRIVLHRVLGIPIFLLMMYLMFLFTIKIGGAFIDFFDQAFGALFVDGLGQALLALGLPEWLKVVLADGVGSGIQTVATFIPIIGFLYVFLSVLEDSGYMARAAFVMDRFMRWVGLPGKSFVPLIVGFGCNVPAVMATRTLEQHRDRLMTIAMAPFMSCGARLPVYVLFAAAFFPHSGQNVVFALYLLGIAVAVLTGLTLRHSLLAGEAAPFVMELPPYHLPTVGGVLIHSYRRLKEFIWRAGRVIVPMVLVLNFLNAAGTDGTYGNQDSENSVLAAIGRTIAPAFSPLGLDEENWPAAVGIFTGVLAKEAVVGTLDATYTALARQDAGEEEDEAPFVLTEALTAAFATIPENLASAIGEWRDPMGVTVGDLTDSEALAEKDVEVAASTFGAMAARFHGAAGAMAYLIFILLYAPCTAAIATVAQEAGLRWAAFVTLWTTGMGYGVATLYYQMMNWNNQPAASAFWIGLISAGFVLVFLGLRRYGRGGGGGTPLPGGDVLQRA